MKKSHIIISIAIILFFLIVASLYLDLVRYAGRPADARASEVVVALKPGEGFKSIAQQLHDVGVIQNPFKFSLLARIKGFDKKVKAGEYLLSARLSPGKILDQIVSGKVLLHKLTIPEGYDLRQIAAIVAASGLVKAEDFLRAAADPVRVNAQRINADTFEGYLFPETYYFPKDISSDKMIATMVRRFRSIFLPEWKQRARELGFSIHEIMTLASMIEKEAAVSEERPLISSVFHNRLKKRMRLESDPTVVYGLEGFNGNITRKHLTAQRPYNTYWIKGLPPGPIANPGIKSIEAALYPADTPYLYFVSKKDNTHYFSTDINEHNRAVQKYQLNR